MSYNASNQTTFYKFPLFSATDKPSWLTDWNNTFNHLDMVLSELHEDTSTAESVSKQNRAMIEALQNTTNFLTQAVDSQGASLIRLGEVDAETEQKITRIRTQLIEISDNLKQSNQRIADLETADKTINSKLTELSSRISNNSTNINTLNQKINSINQVLDAYAQQVLKFSNDLASVLGTINSLKSDMSDTRTRVTTLETSVSNNTSSITALESAVKLLSESLPNTSSALSDEIERITADVSSLGEVLAENYQELLCVSPSEVLTASQYERYTAYDLSETKQGVFGTTTPYVFLSIDNTATDATSYILDVTVGATTGATEISANQYCYFGVARNGGQPYWNTVHGLKNTVNIQRQLVKVSAGERVQLCGINAVSTGQIQVTVKAYKALDLHITNEVN